MAVTGRKKPRRVMQAFGGARVIDVVGGALGWGVGPTHKRQGIRFAHAAIWKIRTAGECSSVMF
jgi:hypothetical protein